MPPEVLDNTVEDQEQSQEPSLRETIEEAVAANEDQSAGGQPGPAGDGQRAPGKADGSPAEKAGPEGAKPAAPATPAANAPGQPVGKPATPQELKAPSQWKPQVREKWNTIPREVQEEILRRENDSLRLIGSVGQKIKFADDVGRHLAPFAERLQSQNIPPQEFLGDVFSTVKSLATGTMEEKAAVVSNIIQSYGIDLRVLDTVLSQRLSAPPPSPEVIQARQLAARAQAVLQQQAQGSQEQARMAASQTLAQFGADPKNEFFEDVRDMMADLLQAGRATSLDEAYTACIWAHPDTRKILLQREAEQRVSSRGQRAQQARRASSSVHGAPLHSGGVSARNPKASLRETIEAAFDEHSQL